MNVNISRAARSLSILGAVLLGTLATPVHGAIPGLNGSTFQLTAKADYISTGDGNSVAIWGYANGTGRAQYPGPTLIVSQGATVTINLSNELNVPVSIVFPGQSGVTASGSPGLITAEAAASGGIASYSFVASEPGTYMYHSGTEIGLQFEMGLFGVLIVRPQSTANRAYSHVDTRFDLENLFVLSEMDPEIHDRVDLGETAAVDQTEYKPLYWFINGRTGPDTLFPDFANWLPTQPYGSLARMHPGDRLLIRVVTASRDQHPFHHHGNHARIIARDGRMLASGSGTGPDQSYEVFTIPGIPGQTVDAIFEWTGAQLGWDVYGHTSGQPMQPGEYAPDHGKPFPVQLPELQSLTFGGFYSGSPFLGVLDYLPPGEGGLNLHGGFHFMWHSHTEKELVNFDIFPGGMMTMLIVEPSFVPID
jgi:FtsP/CotA-like multicopper oxidase with cupredoxin domain